VSPIWCERHLAHSLALSRIPTAPMHTTERYRRAPGLTFGWQAGGGALFAESGVIITLMEVQIVGCTAVSVGDGAAGTSVVSPAHPPLRSPSTNYAMRDVHAPMRDLESLRTQGLGGFLFAAGGSLTITITSSQITGCSAMGATVVSCTPPLPCERAGPSRRWSARGCARHTLHNIVAPVYTQSSGGAFGLEGDVHLTLTHVQITDCAALSTTAVSTRPSVTRFDTSCAR
jgi:hypothetical protein